jgi:hypothetical protein
MGTYSLSCSSCGLPFLWFSGNTDQLCDTCRMNNLSNSNELITYTSTAPQTQWVTYTGAQTPKAFHVFETPNGKNVAVKLNEIVTVSEESDRLTVSLQNSGTVYLKKDLTVPQVVDLINEVTNHGK